MKKLPTEILTFLLTFGLGFCVVLAWYLHESSKIDKVNSPILLTEECKKSDSFPGISKRISKTEKGKSGYFPDGTFAEGWEGADAFMNDWYGKHLKASNEKSLLDVSDKNLEIYRFTWLRSFHHPVIVKIEKQKNDMKIFFKELDGRGGYEPGKIIKEKEKSISQEDWCEFIKLLNDLDYWQVPSLEEKPGGNDGAQWILEGVTNNRYHIVDRWTPRKGKYREIGLFMLKLAGFNFDKNKDDLY